MTLRPLISASTPIGLILVCCLGTSVNQLRGDEVKELEILRTHIRNLQAELATARKARDSLFLSLQHVEQAIGQSTQQLVKLNKRIAKKNRYINNLEKKYIHLQDHRSNQRELLARQVRNAYITSRQETLKLLLSQQDLTNLSRALTYFSYFHRSQNQHIDQISQALKAIAKLQAAIHNEQTQLSQLHTQIARKRKKLKADYQTRSQILAQLKKEIQEKDAQLQTLRKDEQALEQIVNSLHQLLLDIPADALNTKPFGSLRGKLSWPCQGPIIQHFGAPRIHGKYHAQGIMIAAEPGDPVRAVFYGRVAFADWLRGYGLLLIVDHGDGYMTLYGHNESLFKEVGDWVDTGEMIARAGNSGGHHQVGVYFELRHQGNPTNPLSWLMKPS